MKTKLIFSLFSLLALGANAQSISPSTLNSTGGSIANNGNVYEWSFGEMTIVNTFTTAGLIVTQGVLQVNPTTSSVKDLKSADMLEVSVYPNPSNDVINIKSGAADGYLSSYMLTDAVGRKIAGKEGTFATGSNQASINMKDLSAGMYFLQVCGRNHSRTYQVQKTN